MLDREIEGPAPEYRAQVYGKVGIEAVGDEVARGHEERHIVGMPEEGREGKLDRGA